MRDEPKDNQPRPSEMPFLSTPTETVYTDKVGSGKQPSITLTDAPGTTDFVLGDNTCGFTSASTITCESGYQCTNVGDYRGCCLPEADDCVSTIHTDCVDYTDVPNPAYCGPHTLCCSSAVPYCFSYGFIISEEPGATFTHVQCQQTQGYGEMYPLPPELMPTTSADEEPTSPSSTSPLTVQPTDEPSSHKTPVGAIVGAVIGAVILIVLAIIAAVLIIRRRRQRAVMTAARNERMRDMDDAPPLKAAALAAPAKEVSRLRPLSTIHEQTSPHGSPLREKRKSARHSFAPQWPLGTGNPLTAHPIGVEKGLGRSATITLGSKSSSSSSSISSNRSINLNTNAISARSGRKPVDRNSISNPLVPVLNVPTPAPPRTGLAPPPPKSSSSSSSPHTPTSATALVQSPRLSYVPVSPIDIAFGSEADGRRGSRLWVDTSSAVSTRSHDHIPGIAGSGASTTSFSTAATATAAAAGAGAGVMASADGSTSPEVAEPVSPIDDDEQEEDAQRFSLISAPSAPGERDHEHDQLVSPVSPTIDDDDGVSSEDDSDSPATVSPLDSRRGSLEP
ncbi:hypothetical protein F4779DRAFT_105301 [Xylariaceae sp. FL0662B]|nr:hypothetical protein F4779DRAFT_105301 [Xylariaceae sp. FL0662B]